MLGVSTDLIYDLVHKGRLPSLRLGRRRVIPAEAIGDILKDATVNFERSPSRPAEAVDAGGQQLEAAVHVDGVDSYTVREAMDRIGVSDQTIRNMVKDGRLRRSGSGRPLRIDAASMHRFCEGNR